MLVYIIWCACGVFSWDLVDSVPALLSQDETTKVLSILRDVNSCKIWNMYRFFPFPL